jgi:hypothetical protein
MLYCSSRKHTAAGNWRSQNKTIVMKEIFFRMDSSINFFTTVYISFSVAQHDVTHHPAYQPELLSSRTVRRWRWVYSFTLRPLYTQGKNPSTNWIRRWVGPRADPDVVKKRRIMPCWESNAGCPASSPDWLSAQIAVLCFVEKTARYFVQTRRYDKWYNKKFWKDLICLLSSYYLKCHLH